jgi:hypothetical protein
MMVNFEGFFSIEVSLVTGTMYILQMLLTQSLTNALARAVQHLSPKLVYKYRIWRKHIDRPSEEDNDDEYGI